MKTLLKLFVIAASAIRLYNPTLQAATITNYITDGFGNPLDTRVIITPFTISTVFGGTNVLGPSAGFGCTNGAWRAGLLGGFYYVDQGLGQPAITIWATPGDNIVTNLAYFASAATNPLPSFFWSGAGVMTNFTGQVITNFIVYTNLQLILSNAAPNFFLTLDANSNVTSTLNGGTMTNLLIRYDTNAIPTSGALTFGHAYFTNLQSSVTLAAFITSGAYYESLAICSTNSTGSDTTYTFPPGVKVALANGGGNTITVTNKSRAMVFVDHYGALMTNAWAVYY